MPLHHQAKLHLENAASLNVPVVTECTPQDLRNNLARRKKLFPTEIEPVASVQDDSIPGPSGDTPIRIYKPEDDAPYPLIMFFHGGGWMIGDLDAEDTTCRGLCRRVGAVVVSVDYRLAPETLFPGAVNDCYSATVWAAQNASKLGANPSQIATAGTSSGGNLCAAVALKARDEGDPPIAHQLLFCPAIDYRFDRPSYIENAEGFGLTAQAMRWFWDQYLGYQSEDLHPYACPIRDQNLSGLAAATVITAEYDVLRDEAEDYADAMSAAGVDVQCTRYDGMIHGFNAQLGIIDRAKEALNEAATRLNASFSGIR